MAKQQSDVISLRYTIDYPRVELHPFDTCKFKIFYADNKIDAKYDCNKCIELRASNRQSRDLIALLIKCFSAQTYFINSKIIANIAEDDIGEDESGHFSFVSSSSGMSNPYVKAGQENQGKRYTVSDVLFELE